MEMLKSCFFFTYRDKSSVYIYRFGSVRSNGFENVTKNRTKPHRFSIGSVQFLNRTKKIVFFLFGLDIGSIGFF
jgi:hypothetical protein